MNQTLAETKFLISPKCRCEAETAEIKCPRCGGILFTATKIRALGELILIHFPKKFDNRGGGRVICKSEVVEI